MFAHTEETERQTQRRTQFNYPHIFQLPKYTKLLNSAAWQTSSKFWSPRVVSYTLKSNDNNKLTSSKKRRCENAAGGERWNAWRRVASGKWWQMVLMTNEEPVSHPVLGIFSFFGYLALDVAVVTPLDQLDWLAATPRAPGRQLRTLAACPPVCLGCD